MKKYINHDKILSSGHGQKKLGAISIWVLSFFAHAFVVTSLIILVLTQVPPKESTISVIQLMPTENDDLPIEEIVKIQIVNEKNISIIDQEEKMAFRDFQDAKDTLALPPAKTK